MQKIDKINIARKNRNTTYFQSKISFLQKHNGFRPGKIHIVLGPTSVGKSSFMRSVMYDVTAHNPKKKIGVILSEETEEEFMVEMIDADENFKEVIDRFSSHEELNVNYTDPMQNIEKIKNFIIENEIDILFYDNITTSDFYDGQKIDMQAKYAGALKKICKITNIPFVLIAHTASSIYGDVARIISAEDIRGNRRTANIAEFLYTLQMFSIGADRHTFLNMKKYRGFVVRDTTYGMDFDPISKTYRNFTAISFNDFKGLFSERNKLR